MNKYMRDQILPRVRSDALKQTVNGCFGVGELIEQTRTKLEADRNLSEDGKRTKLADIVKTDLVHRFVQITRAYRQALESLDVRRAQIKPAPIDRTDVVAEAQRAEVRSVLRALPPDARSAKAFELANSDDLATAAILDRPAMTDLPRDRIEAIRNQHLKKLHGPAIEALQQASDEVAAVGGAVDAAARELQAASGFPQQIFDDLVKQLAKQIG